MNVEPGIFTPVSLRIERVLAGPLAGEIVTGYVRAGTIQGDDFSYCVFTTSKQPFLLWDGRTPVKLGDTYLAFFGPEIVSGSERGPLEMAEIVELMEVRGGSFVNEGQSTPQPLQD